MAPAGLTASRQPDTRGILLGWKSVPGVERYEIEIVTMSPDASVQSRIVAAPAANVTYGVADVSPASTYSFRIRGCVPAGCSEWAAPVILAGDSLPRPGSQK